MAVWWPWLLVWGITALSLVAAVAMAVTHWRRYRAPAAARLYSSCFYLDDKAVMDLYRQYGGKYKGALRHEVEERISSNRELGISIGHAGDTVPPVLDAARCLGRVEDWDPNPPD
jgi:hypothetical protein